jgi:hypothetical protein
VPAPKDNEVLVKIHASTVSPGVFGVPTGRHPYSLFFTLMVRIMFGIRKPRYPILGYEFSGMVVRIENRTLEDALPNVAKAGRLEEYGSAGDMKSMKMPGKVLRAYRERAGCSLVELPGMKPAGGVYVEVEVDPVSLL